MITHARSILQLGIATLAALAAAAVPATAQQQPDSAAPPGTHVRRLPPVVTTVTRSPTRVDELPQRVQTITSATMERTSANDVTDALKELVGVDVVQYPSLLSGIGIRGFRPAAGGVQQRVLVLLDGRPAGAYNLGLLDLSNIERIEVVRGPASAVYGSSAVGGVVNLITRSSHRRLGGSLSAAYASYRTTELTLRAGGLLGQVAGRAVDADLSLRRYDRAGNYRVGSGTLLRRLVGGTDAIKLYPNDASPPRPVPDTAGAGLTRDYTTFATLSGSGRLGATLPGHLRIDVRGEGSAANDVLSPGDIYTRLSSSPGNLRKNVARWSEDVALTADSVESGRATFTHAPLLRLYRACERSEYYDQPGPAGFVNYRSTITTDGLQIQETLRSKGHSVVVGLDGSRIEAASSRYAQASGTTQEIGTYSPNSRLSSAAAFAEAQLRTAEGRVTATVGARLDRVTLDVLATPYRADVTGGPHRFIAFDPSAGLQVALVGGLRAHGTVGRAFLAPDAFGVAGLSEMITSNVASITVGNPGLRAEHSTTVDGGLSFNGGPSAVDADVTVFRTDVDDRITTARATFASGSRPTTASGLEVSSIQTAVNAGQARIRGVEAQLRYDVGRALGRAYSVSLFAGLTRLLRATEATSAVRVDTTGFSAIRDLDARQVFGAIVLGPGNTTARIRNVATATVTYGVAYDDRRRWTAGLSGRYVGRRLDTDFSDVTDPSDIEYPPFMVFDGSAGVRVGGRYRIDALVGNLTDENYYEKRGYNLAGRTMRVRVTAGF